MNLLQLLIRLVGLLQTKKQIVTSKEVKKENAKDISLFKIENTIEHAKKIEREIAEGKWKKDGRGRQRQPKLLEPPFQKKVELVLAALDKKNIQYIITETFRTAKNQEKDYKKGRTIKGSIITNARAGQSMHNYGRAIDIYPKEGGKICWSRNHHLWDEMVAEFRAQGFICGDDFGDSPHFSISPYKHSGKTEGWEKLYPLYKEDIDVE